MIRTLGEVTDSVLAEIAEEKRLRRTDEVFILFSLGSQFDHLIKQKLDNLGVFCLVADPARVKARDIGKIRPKGIILSGGPASVREDEIPFDEKIFALGIPVLGICLGYQLWARFANIEVNAAGKREFGTHELTLLDRSSALFKDCPEKMPVLHSHGDRVEPDKRLHILAATENSPAAAARFGYLYGVQFHPEVPETAHGDRIFSNFCFDICGAKDVFPAKDVAWEKIEETRALIDGKKVLLAASGGSDSSVVEKILKHAVAGEKGRVKAVYIDGVGRLDDKEHVIQYLGNQDWLELEIVDATAEFLKALKGKRSGHAKRLAIRKVYKEVLERKAREFGADFIAQGTLYTDISESGYGYQGGAKKARIKLHHNVKLNFYLPELTPLDDCVKDTARNIGREIGVPEELLVRHPFPGPGLVARIEGEITPEKLAIARAVDKIYVEEMRKQELYNGIWQAGADILLSRHTCSRGDDAFSGMEIELWAFWSVNGFTARFAELPWEFIGHVSRRITNEVYEVGSVTYNVSGKPPRTIERI